MEKLLIAVPTLNRVHKNPAVRLLPPEWTPFVKVFCPPEEIPEHRKRPHAAKVGEFVPTTADLAPFDKTLDPSLPQAIALKRQFMVDYALAHGYRYLLMADDDVRFMYRPFPGSTKLSYHLSLDTYENMLRRIEETFAVLCPLDGRPVAVIGISKRPFNDKHAGATGYYKKVGTVFVLDLKIVQREKLKFRFSSKEDLDYQLQLILRGYATAVLFDYVFEQEANARGGCATWRDAAVRDATSYRLAELYPNFVKVTTRRSRSKGEHITVTLYLNKAARAVHPGLSTPVPVA